MRRLMLLVLVLALAACGRQTLYSKLTEQQANEVEAALLSSGIAARKVALPKEAGFAVEVGHGDVPLAMQVLRSQGLPREPLETLGQVFQKEGFVSSPLEERARYLHALSQELSRTLMEIDGVVSARVHIALPQRDLLSDESVSASASVVIVERPDAKVRERETDIKAIVTDGVEGLDDVNRVTVKFFTRAPGASGAGDEPVANLAISQERDSSVASLVAVSGVLLLGAAGFGGSAWWSHRRRRATAPVQPQ